MTTGLFEFQAISPTLVHKDSADDVLICNDRGLCPTLIQGGLIAEEKLRPQERVLLENLYCPVDQANLKGLWYLRHLPYRICERDLQDAHNGADVLEIVHRHYSEQKDCFVLNPGFIDEETEGRLLCKFMAGTNKISDYERACLSKIFDQYPEIERPQDFYVNMLNDTQHYFFYRKHHEHVPGIMLIEVARQAMYAQYYKYSGISRGDASLTIERLEVNFRTFVDANYPVRIQVTDISSQSPQDDPNLEIRHAVFYQAEKRVADIVLRGVAIRMKLFKRLRNVKPPEQHRFIPIKNIFRNAMFVAENGVRLDGYINDLSLGGLNASFDDPAPDPGSLFDVVIFVDGLGLVTATVELRWSKQVSARSVCGFKIVNMSASSHKIWCETLKNFTFLNTQRASYQ